MSILTLHERAEGKAGALRREGWVPVGYIVRGQPTMTMKAIEGDLVRALATAHGGGMVDVQFDGEKKKRNAVIKLVERGILDRRIQTVVLMDVNLSEELTVDVPIVGIGMPDPVKRGEALLDHPTNHVKIRGKAGDLPSQIEHDVSAMQVGDHVTAGDLAMPSGMELIGNADALVFSVSVLRAVQVDTDSAAGEPEVVGSAEPEATTQPEPEPEPEAPASE